METVSQEDSLLELGESHRHVSYGFFGISGILEDHPYFLLLMVKFSFFVCFTGHLLIIWEKTGQTLEVTVSIKINMSAIFQVTTVLGIIFLNPDNSHRKGNTFIFSVFF